MIALCVDDEKAVLSALVNVVKSVPQITEVAEFDDEIDAIEWAKTHNPDIAFLDIELHTMDGLTLALKLREMHPDLAVIFCTGYESYAIDAIKLHIDAGYLMKPVRFEAVKEEMEHIFGKNTEKLITAVCFGDFEVYADGKPIVFARQRSKELLAFLIDRKGAMITHRRLAVELLPHQDDDKKGRQSIYQAAYDLGNSLRAVGAEAVFISGYGGYAVDTSLIDCDYYRMLKGDVSASYSFCGEYMSQYSWANETCGYLETSIKKRLNEGKL